MALQVVGSGLGRTGTLSLKIALEQLGFGPCYHMMEVFAHPESIPLWIDAAAGRPDWETIFGSYRATVDYPSAHYWRQIAAHYPEAKIIHTLRDPERWFESTQATIFSPASFAINPPDALKPFFAAITDSFDGHIHDKDFMIAYFNRHDEDVMATVPRDKLLVFEAAQGWEPLCAFLGAAVPDTPFPSVNSTAEFQARIASTPPPR